MRPSIPAGADLLQGAGSADYGEEVVASAAGEVSVRVESDGDHVTVVNHGGGWTSEYRHMATRAITSGHVNQGARVGTVGNESHGDHLSPHLHYEQKLNRGGGSPTMPVEMPGVATISRAVGDLDVFAKKADNSFEYKQWNGSSWSSWINLGGQFLSNPAVVNWGSSRLDVFGVGPNGTLWQQTWTATNDWYPWVDTGGGRIQWTPAATSRGFGQIDVFAVNDDEQVMHRRQIPIFGAPSVSHRTDSWMDVFVRDPQDKTLMHVFSGDGGQTYRAPADTGGTLVAQPASVSWASSRIDVFSRGTNGHLYQRIWSSNNPNGWYGYVDLGAV